MLALVSILATFSMIEEPGCKGIKIKGSIRIIKLALTACLVLLTLQARLQAGPTNGTLDINNILSSSHLKGASVGIHVVSLPDEKVLFSSNSDMPFIVASNMKLLTTAAALQFLGAEYKFKTTVFCSGNISEEGILDGDIVIRGGGDPNISGRFYDGRSTAVLERWASVLSNAGIREVGGDIIADDTYFDREYIHPSWPRNQLSNWYCAPVSGLSFNDNCIELRLLHSGDGRIKVAKEPGTRYVSVHNSCRLTKKKKDSNVVIVKKPGANEIFVKGKVYHKSVPATYFVTVDDPPLYLVNVFKEVLEKQGVKVHGQARLIADEDANPSSTLHELTSTSSTMAQSVKVANTNSQNLYAEHILKTLGTEIKGEGSFDAGLDVIREFLLELGYTPDRYKVADGSGLSRENRLSPQIIVDVLAFMYRHRDGDVFYSSLPVSGKTGTLRRRLSKEPYKGRVRAKTGYIYKASALSGYIETLSGRTLAFSILINDFKTSNSKIKQIQDSICRVLVNY